jgi:superkiller protein 3
MVSVATVSRYQSYSPFRSLLSISSDLENLTAMTALVAMGILDSDDSLVDAALSEIQGLTLDKRVELDPARDVPQLLLRHHLGQVP